MTGKVLIFFLDTILTFFRVFLFYKKYVEVPESKILIDSNNFDTQKLPYSIRDLIVSTN